MSEIQTDSQASYAFQGLDEEIDLRDLTRLLWRNGLLIVASAVIMSLFCFGLGFVLPKTYQAETSILPTSGNDPGGALAAGISAQLGPAAALLGHVGGNKSADLVEILSSRTMAERVINRCNLKVEFSGWEHSSQLVTKVRKMTSIVAPNSKNKVIAVHVQAPKAELAARVANAYVTELKGMLDEIGYSTATRNRRFIERQLTSVKQDLAKSEERLMSFQASNRLTSLPETVVASIRSISDLEAQRISAQVQRQSTDEALGSIRSKVASLQADPNILLELELKQRSLIAQESALAKAKASFLSKVTELPLKGMELARLERNLQVHNAIYLALSQQYETSLISEDKESEAFVLLDKAEAPFKPVKPNKIYFAIGGLLGGLLIGFILAFRREGKMSSQKSVGSELLGNVSSST